MKINKRERVIYIYKVIEIDDVTFNFSKTIVNINNNFRGELIGKRK